MKINNWDLLDCNQQMIGCELCGGMTVREYQLELVEILKEIDRICTKHDIKYFLMYGTLVGAVRHGGFVPWDDDADIVMPRNEYIRFKQACKEELPEKYDLLDYHDDSRIGLMFPRIRKKNTTNINRFEISRHGDNAGFYVDIILLDYVSKDASYAQKQKKCLQALHRVISPGFSQGQDYLLPLWNGWLQVMKFFWGRKKVIELLERKLSGVKEEDADCVMSQLLISGRVDFHLFNKIHFQENWRVPFEGVELPIPYNALTLLNHNYGRRALREGILLEGKYEDEYQTIMKKEYYRYDDIMYIPAKRTRNAHVDVVFDKRYNCDYYDAYYFTKFDRKKNDKSAIKERKYREKASKYLAVLNANEENAKLACEEMRIRELLSRYKEDSQKDGVVSVKKNMLYAESFLNLCVLKHTELDSESLQLITKILIKASHLAQAKRCIGMMRKNHLYNNEEEILELEKQADIHLEAYYGIFLNNEECLKKYVKLYTKEDCFLVSIVEGIVCYNNQEYMKAENIFEDILKISDEIFLAYHYLGKISKDKGENEKAIQYYKESLNCTLYMPLLEMSLKELKPLLSKE